MFQDTLPINGIGLGINDKQVLANGGDKMVMLKMPKSKYLYAGATCACIVIFLVYFFCSMVAGFRKQNAWNASENASKCIDLIGACAWEIYDTGKHVWPERLSQLNNERRILDGPDPWGTQYRYERLNSGCVISSAGPDRIFGTGDDIVTAFTNDAVVTSRRVGSVTNFGKIGVPVF